MSGAIEAAGDVATGAAWSRVVEPGRGEAPASAAAHADAYDPCLNCGTRLVGSYCHGCGQSAHVHRTLMSIVHDLLHGVFHFEGKIWRTVPMLMLHPGQLTRRYIAGERARYVSPLALFLFTVFLMFAVFSATGPGDLSQSVIKAAGAASGRIEQSRQQLLVRIATAERQRAALASSGQATAAIDRRIASLRADADATQRAGAGLRGEADGAQADGAYIRFKHQVLANAAANPTLTAYKIQSATYKYSWVLILLSTPFVALLFAWRRRFNLYDHATFVTYSISFMSMLVIVLQLIVSAGAPALLFTLLFNLTPPVHIFAQLRGAYGLSVLSALWRTIVLLAFAWMALVIFVLGVVTFEVVH